MTWSGSPVDVRWSFGRTAHPAKGEAFRTLLDDVRPAVAFMLGDDRTDAAAFRVLRAARDAGEIEGMAIAVGADPVTLEETARTRTSRWVPRWMRRGS